MTPQIEYWCNRVLNSWHGATTMDYMFVIAWVVLAGYLVSKVTSFSTK